MVTLLQTCTAWTTAIYIATMKPSTPAPLRTPGLTLIVVFFLFRCFRLLPLRAIAAAFLTAAFTLGFVNALATCLLGTYLLTFYLVARHPADGIGHRVGCKGFDAEQAENTVGALRTLATADAAGAFAGAHLPFIEFDVMETKDGELVLFHDSTLGRAFPPQGQNVAAYEELRRQGVAVERASVQDLTAMQLSSLCLGGQPGLHAPTLAEFLTACVECGARRTLACEVKALQSDAARQRLLDLLSNYLETQRTVLDALEGAAARQYPPLGWAGIIAFPHYFASAFGEFGGAEWRRWTGEMRKRGIPALCCHFHYLDFRSGIA